MNQETPKRSLPGGVQSFEEVREPGYLYVDKTALIHKLIERKWKATFLSRPRRFGKSLLCSTLKALFQGRRDLFQELKNENGTILRPALAIDKLPWDWTEYPVIHLDLSNEDFSVGKSVLNSLLTAKLSRHAGDFRVDLVGDTASVRFENLIIDVHEKRKRQVVVLVDEYDAPLLDTLTEPAIHAELQEALKAFYKTLKTCSEHLRFVFLTGISKFSGVSVFSALNNLDDITLDPDFAEICGITHEEVLETFAPEIDSIVRATGRDRDDYLATLQRCYNGYRFSKRQGDGVYNPYGLLLHFRHRGEFLPYWYETGTPKYLVDTIRKHGIGLLEEKDMYFTPEQFSTVDISSIEPALLLFQCGYLTIKKYDTTSDKYILDYPNDEVRSAFSRSLIRHCFGNKHMFRYDTDMLEALNTGNVEQLVQILESLFAGITYAVQSKRHESLQLTTNVIFMMLGIHCRCESCTSFGRIDVLVETNLYVYLFEYKMDRPAWEALKQIQTKDYALQYKGRGKTVFSIGVSFKSAKRNIEEVAYFKDDSDDVVLLCRKGSSWQRTQASRRAGEPIPGHIRILRRVRDMVFPKPSLPAKSE